MASFLELVEHLIEEPFAKSAYLADPHGYLSAHGFAGFDPGDVVEALRHTADAFPPRLAAHVNPLDGLDHLVHLDLHDVGLESFHDYHVPWEHGDDLQHESGLHDDGVVHHDVADLHHPLLGDHIDQAHAVGAELAHTADVHGDVRHGGHFGPDHADLRHDVDLDGHHPVEHLEHLQHAVADAGHQDLGHGFDPRGVEPTHEFGHDAAFGHDADLGHDTGFGHDLAQGHDLAAAHDPLHDAGHDSSHLGLTHSELALSGLWHDDLTHVDLPHGDLAHVDPAQDPLEDHHWTAEHHVDPGHVDDAHLADHDLFGHDPDGDIHHH